MFYLMMHSTYFIYSYMASTGDRDLKMTTTIQTITNSPNCDGLSMLLGVGSGGSLLFQGTGRAGPP